MRSLVFDTPPLDAPIEILGAAIVTLDCTQWVMACRNHEVPGENISFGQGEA
jgi:hypothetical protein